MYESAASEAANGTQQEIMIGVHCRLATKPAQRDKGFPLNAEGSANIVPLQQQVVIEGWPKQRQQVLKSALAARRNLAIGINDRPICLVDGSGKPCERLRRQDNNARVED